MLEKTKYLVLFLIIIFSISAYSVPSGKVYLAVFYTGKVALIIDFSDKKITFLGMFKEDGKWDLQLVDPESDDIQYVKTEKIQYYMEGKLKGKVSAVGSIKIERYLVDHPILMGQPSKIGNIKVKYYDLSENVAEYGKVKKIGDVYLEYHTYQTLPSYGKIKSIGNLRIDYFKKGPNEGKVESIGKLKAVYNENGEITKLVGNEKSFKIEFWDAEKAKQLENAKSEKDLEQ